MSAAAQPELALHDRVATSDGREGNVAGFYRSADESVLVSFSAYDAAKYRASDVCLLEHDVGVRVDHLPHA
jgi:hypothetical protein